MKNNRGIIVFILLTLFASMPLWAAEFKKPGPKDRCPVCGMKAAMYPKWTAEIVFKDGSYVAFDGPKDMFRFYFHPEKYSRHTGADIEAVYVTEYYSTRPVNAKEPDLYFVLGSDVYGPMGVELVPVKGRAQAETFMKDHNGKRMVHFSEITPSDIPKGMMKMKKKKMIMKGC
jgi:nitrous oxide reductase accessory protein NosL